MKFKKIKWVGLMALMPFFPCSGNAQTSGLPASTTAPAAASHAWGVGEVVKLAHSGVTDDVILAYVKGSQSAYNLSVSDILSLKGDGLSAPVITAMLQHDVALRKEGEQKLSPPALAPAPVAAAPALTATASSAPQPPPAPTASAPSAVVQTPPPPPPQVEVIPVAPGPDYYWDGGYWSWRGGTYVWIGGNWGFRPHGIWWGGSWGHYGGHGGGRGHWR